MIKKSISEFADSNILPKEQTLQIKGGYGGIVLVEEDIF